MVREAAMRKFAVWAVTSALVMGLATCVALAGEDDTDSDSAKPARSSNIRWSPFFVHAFRMDESKPKESKPAAKPKKKPAAEKPPTVTRDLTAERSREEAALLRRLAVCDKLMEIAIRNNDNEMIQRVEVLDERARLAYQQHTASLGDRASKPEANDKAIEKHPGPKSTSKPNQPEDSGYAATGNNRTSRALGGEFNP
jgi:hypothetical protein